MSKLPRSQAFRRRGSWAWYKIQAANRTEFTDPIKTAWLAGILEGEGCFINRRMNTTAFVGIQLGMNDEDVVAQAADLMHSSVKEKRDKRPNHKNGFVAANSGITALTTMLAIYPHMGQRRREKIKACLEFWEHG